MAAVFVLPTSTVGQIGPVAAYVSTGGWAAAAERVLGEAWIVCPSGLIDADEALRWGARPAALDATGGVPAGRRDRPHPSAEPGPPPDEGGPRALRQLVVSRVPRVVKTLVKDGIEVSRSRRFRVDADGPWSGKQVDFVWQRHSLFHTAGLDLADALRRPSVLFAPATTVWEADRWGTHRPAWGGLAERFGERPALTRADVVACGTQEVAAQAERLGADPDRIVITPSGVEVGLFTEARTRRIHHRRALGLDGRFVVGWVGSFRPFHSVERVVDAVVGITDAALLLVGDGPERPTIEEYAARRGVEFRVTGAVDHRRLPGLLGAMDVGLVVAPRDGRFHYSPLKLGEYLAAGLPVVAPDVAPVARRLTDGHDALLVAPGDCAGLRSAVERLRADPELRRTLAANGRRTAELRWSWDEQVRKVLGALDRAARHG